MYVIRPNGELIKTGPYDATCYTVAYPEEMYEVPTKALLVLLSTLTGKDKKKVPERCVLEEECWEALVAANLQYSSSGCAVQCVPVEKKSNTGKFDMPPLRVKRAVRPGTKREKVLGMLRTGATMEQVMRETGWNKHQALEGIRLLNKYSGFGLRQKGNVISVFE